MCGLAQAPVAEARTGAARANEIESTLQSEVEPGWGGRLWLCGVFRASVGRVGRPGARKGRHWRPTGGRLSPQVGAWAQVAGSGTAPGGKAGCRCVGGGVSANGGRCWGSGRSLGGSHLRGGRVAGKVEAGLATTRAVSHGGGVRLAGLLRHGKALSQAAPGR